MLKPILIITPFFAPQTHAAMFRVHKLVKYLPKYGYRPIVLTTDTNYLYNNNKELLLELPDCVEIIRTRHIEPSLRGLRMTFGGKDRSFSSIKNSKKDIDINEFLPNRSSSNRPSRVLSVIYSSISKTLYSIPDAHWTWALASMNTAKKLVEKYDIKIMYTTANPYSHLAIAIELKDKLGVKWIADFRDPCGYGYKNSVNNYFGQKFQQKILQSTFDKADRVTGTSETYSSIFSDLYGLNDSRYTFIPTGVDDAYLPNIRDLDENYANSIIFAGEVMPEQERYIFQVIQNLHINNKQIKIIFIGRSEINKPIVTKILANIDDWKVEVEYVDHLPQLELYNILQSAKACILAPGSNRYWWNNFAKMVDYIALGVPVIADVPKLSEARKELTKAGLGFFLERNSVEEDALRLQEWLVDNDRDDSCADYRNRYLASSQTKAFATLFDEIAKDIST